MCDYSGQDLAGLVAFLLWRGEKVDLLHLARQLGHPQSAAAHVIDRISEVLSIRRNGSHKVYLLESHDLKELSHTTPLHTAALAAIRIAQGGAGYLEIQGATGLTDTANRQLTLRLARVLPIYQKRNGNNRITWQICE